MPIEINNTDLVYIPVPKVATTSLKYFLFEINEGQNFDDVYTKREKKHVHNFHKSFNSVHFSKLDKQAIADKRCVAIVRDPIDRLLSCYKNRVVAKGCLSPDRIDKKLAEILCVSPDPDLQSFMINLQKYRLLSQEVRHHTDLQCDFLGETLDFFDFVFRIVDVDKFAELVNEQAEKLVELNVEQKSVRDEKTEKLGAAALQAAIDYSRRDYDLLKGYYRPPTIDEPSALSASHGSGDKSVPPPFIIWAARRVGGTEFSNILFRNSVNRTTQHEPFNSDRIFGFIGRNWEAENNFERLKDDLRCLLSRPINLKHCAETVRPELNQALLEVTIELGYQHLFQIRRTPEDRLLSLFYSQVTGIWGSKQVDSFAPSDTERALRENASIPVEYLLNDERLARFALQEIFNQLVAQDIKPMIAVYEDLYHSRDEACVKGIVTRICDQLGIDPVPVLETWRGYDSYAAAGNTEKYSVFENIDTFQQESAQLGLFDLGLDPGPLSSNALSLSESSVASIFRIRRSWRSDFVRIEGVGADPECPEARWRIDADGDEIEIFSGLVSTRFGKKHPGFVNGARARFAAIDVPVSELDRIRLTLGD